MTKDSAKSYTVRPAAYAERKATMQFDFAASEIFPLFTATREPEWEPDFRPELLHEPEPLKPGLVFLTGSAKGRTYWVMTRYDDTARQVEYLRVSPASDIALIRIHVEGTDPVSCKATVEYEFTALEEAGEKLVSHMTEQVYDSWIQEWKDKILAYLST